MNAPVSPVDGNGYPPGFFASIAADAHLWQDFPLVDVLRAGAVPDMPREIVDGNGPAPAKTASSD